MKLFLNELSLCPVADSKNSAIERMAVFAKTVSVARQKGFRNIQCDYSVNAILLAQQYSLFDWLNDYSVSREYRDFMYGVIIPPYIDEEDSEFEKYMDAVITFENSEYNDSIRELILVETTLNPEDKIIRLADHHGKSELQELCAQIKYNPYVEEMYSTDWGGNRFIRKIFMNGIVEIVLYKTQRKYALKVKTTGRNLRETQKIAKILEEKFNH